MALSFSCLHSFSCVIIELFVWKEEENLSLWREIERLKNSQLTTFSPYVSLNVWVSIPLWHVLKAIHMSPAYRERSLQIEHEDTLFIGFFPRKLGLSACGLSTWEIIIYLSWLNLWENNDLTSCVFVSLTTTYEYLCVPKRNYCVPWFCRYFIIHGFLTSHDFHGPLQED
jgi:hypothetical protein